jgi:hypothetical protein
VIRCFGTHKARRVSPRLWPLCTKQRGLTLLETLLALIMLSLMIVGVLGLLGSLLVASTKSTDMTAGSFVAQYLFDEATVKGPPKPDGGTAEGVHKLYSHEEALPVDFRYRMVWTKIGEAATYIADGSSERVKFGPDLFHVEVTVWWMVENPDDGRLEGGGKRTVTLERLISYELTKNP